MLRISDGWVQKLRSYLMSKKFYLVRSFIRITFINDLVDQTYGAQILHIALYMQDYRLIKLLLKNKANPNWLNVFGFTTIMGVIEDYDNSKQHNIRILNLLLRYGGNADVYFAHMKSVLFVAFSNSKFNFFQSLLMHNANVNVQDSTKSTLLHRTMLKKYDECPELLILLDCYANTEIRDFQNQTPLHLALRLNNLSHINLLLNYNANFYYKDPLVIVFFRALLTQKYSGKTISLYLYHLVKRNPHKLHDISTIYEFYGEHFEELKLMSRACIFKNVTYFQLLTSNFVKVIYFLITEHLYKFIDSKKAIIYKVFPLFSEIFFQRMQNGYDRMAYTIYVSLKLKQKYPQVELPDHILYSIIALLTSVELFNMFNCK